MSGKSSTTSAEAGVTMAKRTAEEIPVFLAPVEITFWSFDNWARFLSFLAWRSYVPFSTKWNALRLRRDPVDGSKSKYEID